MRRRIINCELWLVIILIVVIIYIIFPSSKAELLDGQGSVEVEENTDLTYYLTITYDGKDKYGVSSSNINVSQLQSGIVLVEDRIPSGLTFTGFVETEDGTIGAVEQSNPNNVCLGKVVDDTGVSANTYHGLSYDPITRKVSFKIENMQAGCQLTIGIKTKTPYIDNQETVEIETRRDFYNYAAIKEDEAEDDSNLVHVYMGDDDATLYTVNYEYINPPAGAPTLKTGATYAENSEVYVNLEPRLDGYVFLGWTSSDVVISDGKFTMPNHDVTIYGSFQSINSYKVTYQIIGASPSGYVLPSEKQYYPNTYVELDSLSSGDVIGNYRFLGWNNAEVLTDNSNYFEMPSHNIVITGRFEENKYKLSYQFYDTVQPPNADNLLPNDKYYYAGETIELDSVNNVSGYEFLGWYQEDDSIMPEGDIIVYGEWKKVSGTFQPSISKTVTSTKDYYRFQDRIQYKITITNNENFDLHDVLVSNTNDSFLEGTGYEVLSNQMAKISTLQANSSIELTSIYFVTDEDQNTVVSKSTITGALSLNDYELAEADYEASVTSNLQSTLKICSYLSGGDTGNVFQFSITGTSNNYESSLVLNRGECKTIYLSPASYKIMEIVPQEYELSSVTGSLSSNGATLTISQGSQYEVNYTNQFRKKGFYHSFGRLVNLISGD